MNKPPRSVLTKDNELQIMSKMADLYALLQPAARHRVHHYFDERLDNLVTIAAVGPAEPVPTLPFHRDEDAA